MPPPPRRFATASCARALRRPRRAGGLRARTGRGRLRVREHPARRAADRREILPGASALAGARNLPAPRARKNFPARSTVSRTPHFRVVTTPAELAAAIEALGAALRAQDRRRRLRRQRPAQDHRPASTPPTPGQQWSGGQPRRGRGRSVGGVRRRSFRSSARRNGRGQLVPFPGVREHPRAPHPRRDASARRGSRRRSLREALELARAVTEALDVQGLAGGGDVPDAGGQGVGQRTRPAPAQLRPPDVRRVPDEPVRAARAGGVRPAVGRVDLLRPAVMVNLLGDLWRPATGAPDWTPGARGTGREAASLRQGQRQAGPQDGAFLRAGRVGGGGARRKRGPSRRGCKASANDAAAVRG